MSFIGKPTTFLDFGAVKINSFPKPIPCTTNADYCQPTTQIDDIAFQFKPSQGEELLTNGDFERGSLGWLLIGWEMLGVLNAQDADNHACQFSTTSANSLVQLGILTVGDFYKVEVTIRNRTLGAVTLGGGTSPNIFDTIGISGQSNGTFTKFFTYTEPGGAGDFIISGSQTFDGCVDNISVVKVSDVSDYTIQIHDFETLDLIDTIPAVNLTQIRETITVNFNWANDVTVSNGCRVIRVFDTANLFEDIFTNNQGWTLGADVAITAGVMRFTDTGAACFVPLGFDCGASIAAPLVTGESYKVTYTVKNASNASVAIFIGNTQGTTRNANGTFIETLTVTGTGGSVAFNFFGTPGQSIEVDDVLIERANDLIGQSECYDLQDIHDCSLLLTWSNKESWGGFDYSVPILGGVAFENKMRITAKFRGAKYPSTKIIGEDSAGATSLDYSTMKKAKILDVDFAPEYIHDGIAAMFEQDIRLIDGVSFILVDEYEPSSPNESRVLFKDLMTSRSELRPTLQPNQINRNE